MNLQQDLAEPFDACPYCLTEITQAELGMQKKPDKAQIENLSAKEKSTKNKEKPIACHYHLGYLSEREKKDQFPDECMVCTQIVDCMLRKTR